MRRLTKDDVTILKGIAIIFIIYHNFFYLFHRDFAENEMDFSPDRVLIFLNALKEAPYHFAELFVSFFGHYGVQVFLFLSGYGLCKSFINNQPRYYDFFKKHIIKIYGLLFTGITTICVYNLYTTGDLHSRWYLDLIIKKIIPIYNLDPGALFAYCGPWWFLALILQFYFIFPFLYKVITKYKLLGFLTLSAAGYIWVYLCYFTPIGDNSGLQIAPNIPMHIPEFCLGIYLAIKKDNNKKVNTLAFILSIPIFVLSNFYTLFFPLSFISVTIIIFYIGDILLNLINKIQPLNKFLLYIGNISMILFMINGFTRSVFATYWQEYPHVLNYLIAIVLLFIINIMLSDLLKNMYLKICDILHKIASFIEKPIIPKYQKSVEKIISIFVVCVICYEIIINI